MWDKSTSPLPRRSIPGLALHGTPRRVKSTGLLSKHAGIRDPPLLFYQGSALDIDGRSVKRKGRGGGKQGGKSQKRKKGEREYMGYFWTEEEEESFEVDALVGKMVADGRSWYANQGKA